MIKIEENQRIMMEIEETRGQDSDCIVIMIEEGL